MNAAALQAGPRALVSAIADFSAVAKGETDLRALLDRAVHVVTANLDIDCCHVYRASFTMRELELADVGRSASIRCDARRIAREALDRLRAGITEPLRTDTALSLVIDGDSAPFGILVACGTMRRRFTRSDEEFVQSVVGVLTDAIRRAHSVRDKARFQAVVTSTGDAIIEVTKDGRIFNWNASAEALFDRSSDDAIGTSAAALFPAGDPDAFSSMLGLVCRGTTLGPMEVDLRKSGGAAVEVLLRLSPIVLPDGRITAVSMSVRDLREKRRADRALEMHADILENMPAAVMVWRLDDLDDPSSLRLVMANRQADLLVGMPLGNRIGQRFADVPLTFDSPDDAIAYATVVRKSEPIDFGERWTGVDRGPARWHHVRAFPLPDRSVGIVFHDVTDQRELAVQLQHAQRLEVIGRLAGGVAHDFNNVLTIINGYSEMLRLKIAGDASAMEDLDEIERASHSAHQLTRQLLAFGRRQVLRPAPIDLHTFLSSSRRMLNRLIGEDIELCVVGQDPVIVCADACQLEQVLLNLVVNARDAMPAGGKLFVESNLVAVESDPVVPPGKYGTLTVSDTGLGMEVSTLARVFEPFFTTKEVGRGTGLGLSTVHGIVKQSGGHVTVKSEPGEGTTFTIYLPASDETVKEPQPAASPARISSMAAHTVMLVEDDETVRFLVRNVLNRAGLTVLEARDPEHALQLAARFTGFIDLLVTDVVMPRQSGSELAARLTMRFPAMKVIYMSGYMRESGGHCKLPPNAMFVQKPFAPADLIDGVQRALQGSTGRANGSSRQSLM
jgi:PAS domain S-box-containing protein